MNHQQKEQFLEAARVMRMLRLDPLSTEEMNFQAVALKRAVAHGDIEGVYWVIKSLDLEAGCCDSYDNACFYMVAGLLRGYLV